MGYIKMAKRIKAKASGESGEKKVKKKPVRTWLQKLFAKAKANRANRKLKRASDNRETAPRQPAVDALNNRTKDNILDNLKETADAAVKNVVNNAANQNTVSDKDVTESGETEKTFMQKNGLIIGIVAVLIVLAIIYFITKKK